MYQVYIKTPTSFDGRKLLGEFNDLDKARERANTELAKNADLKYIIEEQNGSVDSYGELLSRVVEKN